MMRLPFVRYPVNLPFATVHLQWFAAEDEGRTEEPTERKIRKAREEGKVAKSGELTSILVLLFSLVILALLGRNILQTIIGMLRYFLRTSTELNLNTSIALSAIASYVLRLVLPVMAAGFIAAFLGNTVQVGFLFSSKPIVPDFSRISPNLGKWLQRSFFSVEALYNLGKSLVKIAVIGALAWLNIRLEIPKLTNAVLMTPYRSLVLIGGIAFRLMVESALFLFALSLIDYRFQRRQHRESLKMTKHEQKEEYKEIEGDPLVKSRLRQRMQELLNASMARQVPEADVVITNPIHFAVALKWEASSMRAPKVTAKGQDNMALRIRDIAKQSDVPTVENRPLVRALYDNVELGDEVPEEYWEVVSVILAEVYRLSGQAV